MSMITTSWPRALAASIASNTTAPGSDPGSPRTISQPARSAQSVELLGRGRAERVAGGEQHRLAELLLEVPGHLADRGRLAAAVHAGHEDHRRAARRARSVSPLEARRVGEQLAQAAREVLAAGRGRRSRPRSRAARRSWPWSARPRRRRSASPPAARTPRRRASGTSWSGAPRRSPGASSTCSRAGA